jgi:hypothetical protein
VTTYAEWLTLLLPGGLSGRWATAWARAHGEELDHRAAQLREAVFVGNVLDPEGRRQCPDEALPYHGRDAGIIRAPVESLDAWRARIADAWDAWGEACTESGIVGQAAVLGYGTPTLHAQRALAADGHANLWSRFSVVFAGGAAIEGVPPSVWIPLLRATLRTWRSGRDRVSRVILSRGAYLVGLDFVCGTSLCGGAAETYSSAALCGSLVCGSDAAGTRYFD